MKTVTVNVDELEGEALEWAAANCAGMERGRIAWLESEGLRADIKFFCGPTVEVPAELMEGE